MKSFKQYFKENYENSNYVIIYRALPATTTEIRTNDYITLSRKFGMEHAVTSAIYNGEPFYVVRATVKKSDIKEASNPGEYLYISKPFNARPIMISDENGDVKRVLK